MEETPLAKRAEYVHLHALMTAEAAAVEDRWAAELDPPADEDRDRGEQLGRRVAMAEGSGVSGSRFQRERLDGRRAGRHPNPLRSVGRAGGAV